ncbi:hypothetical protein ACLQ2N_08440 [Streptomyces sp. DT224]|uniref:hypothetical protein n=1 Tax=Streptomyces sp. DT224 TaxID=3393426 RepID=UPI003CFB10ED
MNGPEHYRAAERLLIESRDILRPNDEGPCEADRTIAEAQVHATLALAAATGAAPAETAPAAVYVYRAAWGMTPLGTYTNAEAARKHCEADVLNHDADAGGGTFEWFGDESEPDDPSELLIQKNGAESTTDYTVTRIEVAAEYDPEADA